MQPFSSLFSNLSSYMHGKEYYSYDKFEEEMMNVKFKKIIEIGNCTIFSMNKRREVGYQLGPLQQGEIIVDINVNEKGCFKRKINSKDKIGDFEDELMVMYIDHTNMYHLITILLDNKGTFYIDAYGLYANKISYICMVKKLDLTIIPFILQHIIVKPTLDGDLLEGIPNIISSNLDLIEKMNIKKHTVADEKSESLMPCAYILYIIIKIYQKNNNYNYCYSIELDDIPLKTKTTHTYHVVSKKYEDKYYIFYLGRDNQGRNILVLHNYKLEMKKYIGIMLGFHNYVRKISQLESMKTKKRGVE